MSQEIFKKILDYFDKLEKFGLNSKTLLHLVHYGDNTDALKIIDNLENVLTCLFQIKELVTKLKNES